MSDWDALKRELSAWGEAGETAQLWWRDDDAVDRTTALDRLLTLARETATPLALAVIPDLLSSELVARLLDTGSDVQILQHGFRHHNHATGAEKKNEFPSHRLVPEMLGDVAIGWEGLRVHLGAKALPVFVPPWNRIATEFVPRLANANMLGLSTFGARAKAHPAAGLTQINTHVDIVNWRQDRGFIGETTALQACVTQLQARRAGNQDEDEPLGLLTHHLVMDEDGWEFCRKLSTVIADCDGAEWRPADHLFGLGR
jgi:hypothetical protein